MEGERERSGESNNGYQAHGSFASLSIRDGWSPVELRCIVRGGRLRRRGRTARMLSGRGVH